MAEKNNNLELLEFRDLGQMYFSFINDNKNNV